MTLEDVVEIAHRNGRVCPQPKIWNEIYQMLPNVRRVGTDWEPPLPLILAAWGSASDAAKKKRFDEHLRYASEQGALAKVAVYLGSLEPRDWHTAELE